MLPSQFGYVIGIIYGLYFKTSIALFYGAGIFGYALIYVVGVRHIKVSIAKQILLIIIISSIVSNTYLMYINNKYNQFYNNADEKATITGVIISDPIEKDYNYQYIIKSTDSKYKDKKFILYVKKDKQSLLEYGDLIKLSGDFRLPDTERNYGGFNYREYLKSKGIYASILATSNNISVIQHSKCNIILETSNKLKKKMLEKINIILPEKTRSLLSGVLIRRYIRY